MFHDIEQGPHAQRGGGQMPHTLRVDALCRVSFPNGGLIPRRVLEQRNNDDGFFFFFAFHLKMHNLNCSDLQASKIWTPIHYRKYSRVYLRTDLQLLVKRRLPPGTGFSESRRLPGGGI